MYVLNIHKDNAREGGVWLMISSLKYICPKSGLKKRRGERFVWKRISGFLFSRLGLSRGGKWSSPYWGLRIMRLWNLIFTKLPPRSWARCRQLSNPPWWRHRSKSDCQSSYTAYQSPQTSEYGDLQFKAEIARFLMQYLLSKEVYDKQGPPAWSEGIKVVNRQEWTCSNYPIQPSLLSGGQWSRQI